jgi:hypothetical protein
MNKFESNSSRRAFFLQGGAALGASVATAGVAAAVSGKPAPTQGRMDQLQQQLVLAEDREAIRTLHLALTSQIENQNHESGVGKPTILRLRPNHLQQKDTLAFSADRLQATAVYHVDVALGTPLQGNSTIVQMARLQGHMTDHRWEVGKLEAKYVKTQDRWQLASFSYLPS